MNYSVSCRLEVIYLSQAAVIVLLLTAEPEVSLVEADLPGVLLDEREVRLAHVVELECEESLAAVAARGAAGGLLLLLLLALGGRVLRRHHAVLQLVVAAHRVLRLAVVVLRGQLLILARLVVLLVRLHLAWRGGRGRHKSLFS